MAKALGLGVSSRSAVMSTAGERARIGERPQGGGIQHFWLPPGAAQLPRIERAQGLRVWDSDGKLYLDCTSGPCAVNLGHGNARVLRAMREQAERACFAYPSYFESAPNTRLSDLLAAQAGPGLDRAFFVSSGTEAMEKCIEFARMAALARGDGARYKLVSRMPSYHGSTLGALGLTGDPVSAGRMRPLLHESAKVPAPLSYRVPEGTDAVSYAMLCAERLRETIEAAGPESVLAFVMEPIGGLSAGAYYAPAAYYRRVREICNAYGVLLIYDEVISGAGRSGRFLAAHWWSDAQPDLVVLAKGLGSGYYPLACFLAPAAMVESVAAAGGFYYGHTYKASPLGCAVGLAVLEETVERDLAGQAERVGAHLRARLEALMRDSAIVGDVRGKGLLNAIEIVADKTTKAMLPRSRDVPRELSELALAEGLLLYARRTGGGAFGDWLMVTPPLIAEAADIDEIVTRLGSVLRKYEAMVPR
jgi:adenosylmethionine-8-amino-7-oxononanoate aminotransferase